MSIEEYTGIIGIHVMPNESINISVSYPLMDEAHHLYVISGKDQQGPFECKRRYNEFFALFELMSKTVAGIFIPPIPPKKSTGNRDDAFVLERTYFLNKFVKDLTEQIYLYNSPEFQEFIRPTSPLATSDYPKFASNIMSKQNVSTNALLERVSLALKVNMEELISKLTVSKQGTLTKTEIMVNITTIEKAYKDHIQRLGGELDLLGMKVQGALEFKDRDNKAFITMLTQIQKYEKKNVIIYGNHNPQNMILTNPISERALELVFNTDINKLLNTISNINIYQKEEAMAIDSILAAMNVIEEYKIRRSKARDVQDQYQSNPNHEKCVKATNDVTNLTRLINILSINLGYIFLPYYKKKRMVRYYEIMKEFAVLHEKFYKERAEYFSNMVKSIP